MRYFFSLARPEAALPVRIMVTTPAGEAVTFGGPAQGRTTGLGGTTGGAIDLTTITAPTDHHLAVTTGAVK